MVFKANKVSHKGSKHPAYRPANILDRCAAFVVDFSLVFFLHSFLSFYIKSKQSQAFVEGFNLSFTYWLFLNLLLFFVMYFLYQYFSLKIYGKTLGKKIFHIKLRDVISFKTLSKQQAFSYAFWKTISLLLLGIPFWGIVSDFRHRALHEKLSDTTNLTIRNKANNDHYMRDFVRGFLLPVQIALALSFLYFLYLGKAYIEKEETMAVLDMPLSPTCAEIDAIVEKQETHRLKLAIALFAAEEIKSECLEVEAQSYFEEGEDLALANLAFSMLRPNKQDRYLEKACESPDLSDYCKGKINKDSEDYKLILSAKKSIQNKDYKKAINHLKYVKENYFVNAKTSLDLQALYEIGKKQEVIFSIKNLASDLTKSKYYKHLTWMCKKSLNNSCGKKNFACNKILMTKDFTGMNRQVQITYADLKACHKDWTLDAVGVEEVVQDYFQALYLYKEEGNKKALTQVLTSALSPVELKNALGMYLQSEPLVIRRPANYEED